MKKILLIPIMFAYMLAYNGVMLNFHYCMGSLSSTDIGWTVKNTCGKCGMAMKKSSCCQDKTQWLKADDNHKAITADYNFNAPVAFIAPIQFVVPQAYYSQVDFILPQANAPPPKQISLYILNCVFRC